MCAHMSAPRALTFPWWGKCRPLGISRSTGDTRGTRQRPIVFLPSIVQRSSTRLHLIAPVVLRSYTFSLPPLLPLPPLFLSLHLIFIVLSIHISISSSFLLPRYHSYNLTEKHNKSTQVIRDYRSFPSFSRASSVFVSWLILFCYELQKNPLFSIFDNIFAFATFCQLMSIF